MLSTNINLRKLTNNNITTITLTLFDYLQTNNYFQNFPSNKNITVADFTYKFTKITPFKAKLSIISINKSINAPLNLNFSTKTPTLSSIINDLKQT